MIRKVNQKVSVLQDGIISSMTVLREMDIARAECRALHGAFGGSDTDKKNYITATPYMKNYMNAYVVKIARYLEKTSNHVMYRTTPVFVGEELMCRGVLMEAYSVEDNGEGICFNIFLYNVLIIVLTLSPCFLFKIRLFYFSLISLIWFILLLPII